MLFSPYRLLKKIIILSVPFIFLSCATSQRYRSVSSETFSPSVSPSVRILLNEPSENLSFEAEEDFILFDSSRKLRNITKGETLKFSAGRGVLLKEGDRSSESENFLLKTDKNFNFQDKQISGDLKIFSDGKLLYLVNSVTIEEYLKGVIPSEMPLGSGNEYFEGLKAFAITARTYTLQRLSAERHYDVRTDVRDQVYGGVANRREISDRAVDETKGLVLFYDRKPATVFYSSTCAGITEDFRNVFGNEEIPYLVTITDGNPAYCSVSPRFNWEETFSPDRIVTLLKKSGKINEDEYILKDVKVNSRFKSGHINELEILLSGKSGPRSVKLFGNNIRFILLNDRNRTLNSNKFEIIKKNDMYTFKGMGSGHGVGMCQWGTLNQSVLGIPFAKILMHYFPGTELIKYYD
jgi:stage II sporulation protein D